MINASLVKRLVAFLIDTLILSIVELLLYVIVFVATFLLYRSEGAPAVPADSTTLSVVPLSIWLLLVGFLGIAAFSFVLEFVYYAWFESSKRQATPGKMLMRIRVVRADGTRISFLRGLGRHMVKMVGACILYLGYIMVFFTWNKRALHDLLADTVVVEDDNSIEPMT